MWTADQWPKKCTLHMFKGTLCSCLTRSTADPSNTSEVLLASTRNWTSNVAGPSLCNFLLIEIQREPFPPTFRQFMKTLFFFFGQAICNMNFLFLTNQYLLIFSDVSINAFCWFYYCLMYTALIILYEIVGDKCAKKWNKIINLKTNSRPSPDSKIQHSHWRT